MARILAFPGVGREAAVPCSAAEREDILRRCHHARAQLLLTVERINRIAGINAAARPAHLIDEASDLAEALGTFDPLRGDSIAKAQGLMQRLLRLREDSRTWRNALWPEPAGDVGIGLAGPREPL